MVGRFLKHMRVFCFGVAEEREVFLSSADWMERNFSAHRKRFHCDQISQNAFTKLKQLLDDNYRRGNYPVTVATERRKCGKPPRPRTATGRLSEHPIVGQVLVFGEIGPIDANNSISFLNLALSKGVAPNTFYQSIAECQ